jgi:type I restriction enzyme R subunit
VQITTALSQAGIKFAKDEEIELIDPRTGKIDLARTPDEISFAVDEFNKNVITVPFNKTVAEELARHIDPNLPGKTLIFAVSDAHADIVVDEIKKAFRDAYGEIEDAAIRKITGSVDDVGALIRSFRNDTLPKIAVTVDLLTTGIDVPSIENLVSSGASTAASSMSRCWAAPPGNVPKSTRRRSAFSTRLTCIRTCKTLRK